MLVLDTPWLSRLNKDCALVTRAHFLPSLADTTVGSLALPAHRMARLSSVSDFLVVLPGDAVPTAHRGESCLTSLERQGSTTYVTLARLLPYLIDP